MYTSNFPTSENYKKYLRAPETDESAVLQDPTYYTDIVKKVLDGKKKANNFYFLSDRNEACVIF